MFYAVVVVVVLAAAWGAISLQRRTYFLQYLFFWRYSIACGCLLVALPVLALTALRPLLFNLFVMPAEGLLLVTCLAILCAWAVMFTLGLSYVAVPERYELAFTRREQQKPVPDRRNRIPARLDRWKAPLFALLAAPTVGVAWAHSASGAIAAAVQVALGLALAAVLWVCWNTLVRRTVLNAVERLEDWLGGLVEGRERLRTSVALQKGARGYRRTGHPLFRHDGALMLTTIAAVIYGFLGVLGYPSRDIEWVHLQPLQYVLLLLTLLCMGASGLAYFLDLFRVPPTVLVIGALVLSYGVLDTDHDYPVLERQPAAPLSTPLNAAGAFRAWCESHPPATHPVPIFVTASGGGITAALWTARVLQGLQEAAGPHDRRVAESIVLLSTVSGGSVGAMHFLDGFEAGVAPDLARAREAVEDTGRNSLAAAVWGLLYPDLLRSTFVPFLSNTFDRGWALEERWRLALAHPDATLGGLAAEVARGRLPVFVFNATIVESGERLLLSPLSTMKRGGPSAVHEFLQLYPSADLSLVTAARLSASFPYVSPLARPARVAEGEERFHVGDGGYFDNDGVVTALEFLEETPEILAEHGRTRAVLLQIRAFPSEFDPLPGNGPPGGHGSRPCAHVAGERKGLVNALLGPVLTLMKVRTSTQVSRNADEVERFKLAWKAIEGLELEVLRFELPPDSAARVPLSWQLSDDERTRILDAWQRPEIQQEAERLLALLGAG